MGSAMIIAENGKMPKHLANATGKGMENISADMITLPRVKILQDMSPEVKKSSDRRIEGAEPGHILLTTGEISEELFVLNLKVKTGYIAFNIDTKMPFRPMGGEHADGMYPTVEKLEADMMQEGVNPDNIHNEYRLDPSIRTGYQVQESHTHQVLVLDPESGRIKTPALMDFTRTKVRESKTWNTLIASQGGDRYSGVWRVSSKVQSWNDNSWYNYDISFHGWASESLYQEADKIFDSL